MSFAPPPTMSLIRINIMQIQMPCGYIGNVTTCVKCHIVCALRLIKRPVKWISSLGCEGF